jgi:hypothetical protein
VIYIRSVSELKTMSKRSDNSTRNRGLGSLAGNGRAEASRICGKYFRIPQPC